MRANEIWKGMQKDLVSRSTNGKQIISEKAGHVIQQDEPELVVDAIRQVVEATRKWLIMHTPPNESFEMTPR